MQPWRLSISSVSIACYKQKDTLKKNSYFFFFFFLNKNKHYRQKVSFFQIIQLSIDIIIICSDN